VPRKLVLHFRKVRSPEHLAELEYITRKTASPKHRLPLTRGERLFGEWTGLAHLVMRFAFQTTGIPGGAVAAELALSLAGIDNAQTRLLKSMKADTELLRNEPFRTAKLNLSEAHRVGPQDRIEWERFIYEARKELYSAHNLVLGANERAVVEFDLYVVWMLMGREADARHWLEYSLTSALQAIEDYASSLRAYIEDARPEQGKPSIFERAKREIQGYWLDFLPDSVRDPFLAGVVRNLETIVNLADRAQSASIMRRIIVLDDYIKFYNLVQYSMAVAREQYDPDYLELYDSHLKCAFNRNVNHYASLDDTAERKCLTLRSARGIS
jgi:hypothetical protein